MGKGFVYAYNFKGKLVKCEVTDSRKWVKGLFITAWGCGWMLRHKYHCLFIDILLYLDILKSWTIFSHGNENENLTSEVPLFISKE